jgi:2-phosphoglycerate kinase
MTTYPQSPNALPWTVTLVCGASGVGKTSVAVPLAARYGVRLGEVDDIVTALKALTTANQFPLLHFWDTHSEAHVWPPEQIAALHFQVTDALRPAFRAVIADHLEFAAPVVFEGDYLLPDLAAEFGDAVRAVVVTETEERILANYRSREPGNGEQTVRARVSALVGARLVQRAEQAGAAVVSAWPWVDALDRVDRALRTERVSS